MKKIMTASAACALGLACGVTFAKGSFAGFQAGSPGDRSHPEHGSFMERVDDFHSASRLGQDSVFRHGPVDTGRSSVLNDWQPPGLAFDRGSAARVDVPDAALFGENQGVEVVAATPATAVPEPSTNLMLIAGVCAIAFAARRRLRR